MKGDVLSRSLLSSVSSLPRISALICGRIVFLPGRGERVVGLSGGGGHRTSVPGPGGRVTIRSVRGIRSRVIHGNGVLICTRCGVIIGVSKSGSFRGAAGSLRGLFTERDVRVSGETCGRLRLFINDFPNGYFELGGRCSEFLALSRPTLYLVCGRRRRRNSSSPLGYCCASQRNLPLPVSVANGRNGIGCAGGSGFFILKPSKDNGDFFVGSIVQRCCRRSASIIVISANSDCRKVYGCFNKSCVSCDGRGPVSVGPFGVSRLRCGRGFNRGGGFLGDLVFRLFGNDSCPDGVRSAIVGRAVARCCRTCFRPFSGFDGRREERVGRVLLLRSGGGNGCSRCRGRLRSQCRRLSRRGSVASEGSHLIGGLRTIIRSATTARNRGRTTLRRLRQLAPRLIRGGCLRHVRHGVSGVRHRGEDLGISRLSFGACCRFTLIEVPRLVIRRGVRFTVRSFTTVLGPFCGNKRQSRVLGGSLSTALFSRGFVIFRVSGIGSSPVLFPVVILVVVSIFARGVEVGGNEGYLIVRRT